MTGAENAQIIPVLLSGGQGTRLWPLSRAAWPKQFLPLAGEQSLFEDSLTRIADDQLFDRPIVICAHDHRFIIRDMLRAHDMAADLILEPCGRNTAPALCAAARAVQARGDKKRPMLAMPVDHYIPDIKAFRSCVQSALPACEAGRFALFGIRATSAHTGFGYIRQGTAWNDNAAIHEIAEFREKPDEATAHKLVARGDYAWNAGIFLMRAGDYLDELAHLAPRVHEQASTAWRNAGADLDDTVLDDAHFSAAPSISIDHAVLEHSTKSCVIPADFEWDDLGSWDALMDLAQKDAQGTVKSGNVMAEDVQDSYLQSTGPLLCASDVQDIIAVATDDAVMVTRRGASGSVSKIVDMLKSGAHAEALDNTKVMRPWGSYETLNTGQGFKVKHIHVTPGESLSLQIHYHRAEHWVVVRGTARVHCDNEIYDLEANQATYIPLGSTHRLENPCDEPLELIEVQTGDYLGEDDIVRFEDIYGR